MPAVLSLRRSALLVAAAAAASCSRGADTPPPPSPSATAVPLTDRSRLTAVTAEIAKTGTCTPACLETLEALRRGFPQDSEVRAVLKQIHLQRQDWQALLRLEDDRPPGRRSPEEARELAAIQINAGRYAEAVAVLEPLVAAQPGDAELARLAGQALFHLAEYDRAIPHLDRAASALGGEDGSEAATCRGLIHFYRGEARQAEAVLRRATTLAPQHLPAFNALGRVLAARGAQGESRAMFAQAARIQAAATEVERRQRLLGSLAGMANEALAQRRYDDCDRLIQQMLELADPLQKVQLYGYLAEVLKAAGRPADAEAALKAAARLNAAGSR